MSKKLKLLSWNVNGLRAVHRKDALQPVFDLKPDILCLQETKSSEDQLPDEVRNITGYTSSFCSGAKKGYSGVGIYSKLAHKNIATCIGEERFDTEGRVQVADYDDFVLCNIYFPNGKASKERLDFKMDFYKKFLEYVNELVALGKKVIICGDVNTAHKPIDLARPQPNEKISGFLPIEREWIDKLIDHGFIDTFRMLHPEEAEQYTWWDMITRARERNVGWRIDYFFISSNLKDNLRDAFIHQEIMGSDHCPVGIDLEF
ncbi:MAG: exodeoxyribonuclease III [Candidatus Dojkabacteria bacterium]